MLKHFAKLLLIGCAAVAAASAAAEPKKVWACAAAGTSEEDLYLVEWGSNSYIKLYDVRVWGNFEVIGEDRRWDFGSGNSQIAEYSAVLKPNGELDYYDFRDVSVGDAVAPAYKYNCRLAQG
jgi:hypothetical protein